jgi:hypothetical protein
LKHKLEEIKRGGLRGEEEQMFFNYTPILRYRTILRFQFLVDIELTLVITMMILAFHGEGNKKPCLIGQDAILLLGSFEKSNSHKRFSPKTAVKEGKSLHFRNCERWLITSGGGRAHNPVA